MILNSEFHTTKPLLTSHLYTDVNIVFCLFHSFCSPDITYICINKNKLRSFKRPHFVCKFLIKMEAAVKLLSLTQ